MAQRGLAGEIARLRKEIEALAKKVETEDLDMKVEQQIIDQMDKLEAQLQSLLRSNSIPNIISTRVPKKTTSSIGNNRFSGNAANKNNNSNAIQINPFIFDIPSDSSYLLKDLIFHKKEIQIIMGTQLGGKLLLDALIQKFLPNGQLIPFYVSNKSIKEDRIAYGVRPLETSPVLNGKKMTVCFEFHERYNKERRQTRLLLNRISTGFNQSKTEFEVLTQLMISNSSTQMMDLTVLSQNISPHCVELCKKLEEWNVYLDWQEKQIRKRQFGLRYFDLLIDNDKKQIRIFSFSPKSQEQKVMNRLKRLKEDEMLVSMSDNSTSNLEWKPRKKTDSMNAGILINSDTTEDFNKEKLQDIFKKPKNTQIENGDEEFLDDFEDEEESDSETEVSDSKNSAKEQIVFEIDLDFSPIQDEINFDNLPPDGFLLNSVIGDLHMIQIQRTGIRRFQNLEAVNNNLSNFLFSSKGAQISHQKTIQIDYLRKDLNDEQKAAVQKAILAPELFLMQGPPGTGKTTTITEISNHYCLNGERVLIASQMNLAVDNALTYLYNKNYILAMRKGDNVTEFGDKFLQKNVLKSWFESIRESCKNHFESYSLITKNLALLKQTRTDIGDLIEFIKDLKNRQDRLKKEIISLEVEKKQVNKNIEEVTIKINDFANVKSSIRDFLNNCSSSSKGSQEIELLNQYFMLIDKIPKDYENLIQLPDLLKFQKSVMLYGYPNIDLEYNSLKYLLNVANYFSLTDILQVFDGISEYYNIHSGINLQPLLEQNEEYRELMHKHSELEFAFNEQELHNLKEINQKLNEFKSQLQQEYQYNDWYQYQKQLLQFIKNTFPSSVEAPAQWKENLYGLIPKQSLPTIIEESKQFVIDFFEQLNKIAEIVKESGNFFINIIDQIQLELDKNETIVKTLNVKLLQIDKQINNQNNQNLSYDQQINENVQNGKNQLTKLQDIGDQIPITDMQIPTAVSNDTLSQLDSIISTMDQSKDIQNKIEFNAIWGSFQSELLLKYQQLDSLSTHESRDLQDIYSQNVNVLGLTCAEAGNKRTYLTDYFKPFDVVIIDEVSRATAPELLLPMLLAKKVILMGDQRQLPPVFKQQQYDEFEKEIKKNSDDSASEVNADENSIDLDVKELSEKFKRMVTSMLFDELFRNAPIELRQTLQVQYRFHPQIMEIVNCFYQDTPLSCGLADPDNEKNHNLTIPGIVVPSNHVLWIDSAIDHTARKNKHVQEDLDKNSKYNLFEIDLMVFLLVKINEHLRNLGYSPQNQKRIGIITFYGAQVKRIRNKINEIRSKCPELIDCIEPRYNTVDKFQGMEREIVIVSLVRTALNPSDFVRNYQRINVAFSRAKELLIILGNSSAYSGYEVEVHNSDGQLEKQYIYDRIISLIKDFGGYRTSVHIDYNPIEIIKHQSSDQSDESKINST